jgi:hypothetical protein
MVAVLAKRLFEAFVASRRRSRLPDGEPAGRIATSPRSGRFAWASGAPASVLASRRRQARGAWWPSITLDWSMP